VTSLNGAECADAGAVSSAWGTWLHTFSWGWWCHLTFRLPPAREKAEKLFTAWIHRLNQKIFGRSFYRFHTGARWARGIEWQRRGAIHFHVLIAETEQLDIKEAVRKWRKLSGGNAVIDLYDPTRGATHYLAKVYSGLQTGEIHIGGRWHGRAASLVGRVA
jgi:hypothetical protein